MGREQSRNERAQARRLIRRGCHRVRGPDALDGPDLKHSEQEERSLRLGRSLAGRVLAVAYAIRGSGDDEKIRIISARRASRKERAAYASGAAD